MGGNTGNLRTLRNQSGTVGVRTLGSILASDSGCGAGSIRRVYGWYKNNNPASFYNSVFNLNYGEFQDRAQYFMKTAVV